MLFTVCVAVAALVVVGGGRGTLGAAPPPEELLWDNDFGDPLLVECQSGYALHRARIQFSFSLGYRWDWECKKVRIIIYQPRADIRTYVRTCVGLRV